MTRDICKVASLYMYKQYMYMYMHMYEVRRSYMLIHLSLEELRSHLAW